MLFGHPANSTFFTTLTSLTTLTTLTTLTYQERMLLGHPANSTFFMQPGGKLAMHVQDGSPLTTEVHEGG